jgi:hypothetical protein
MSSDERTPLRRLTASDANARHAGVVAVSDKVIDVVAGCDVLRCALWSSSIHSTTVQRA